MKMQVKKYSKLKMFGLYSLSVFVNILPLIVVLIINWKACTKTTREGVAITITGIAWLLFLVISIKGTMPNRMNRAVTLSIVFIFLLLMKPLLDKMCIFAGSATLGCLLDVIFVRPLIIKYRELRVATKTADLTTEQVKVAIQEALKEERNGRV